MNETVRDSAGDYLNEVPLSHKRGLVGTDTRAYAHLRFGFSNHEGLLVRRSCCVHIPGWNSISVVETGQGSMVH